MEKHIKKIIAGALSVLTICSIFTFTGTSVYAEKSPKTEVENAAQYSKYLDSTKELPEGTDEIAIKANSFLEKNDGVELLGEYKGKKNSIVLSQSGAMVTWSFEIKKEGIYNISLMFYALKQESGDIQFNLLVDGKNPFVESANISLIRTYKNETDINTDNNGNQFSPRQIEDYSWQDYRIKLSRYSYDDPMKIYLSKGSHTLTIINKLEKVAINSVSILPVEKSAKYQDYFNQYSSNDSDDKFIKLEGEAANKKSNAALRPSSDKSNPLTTPYSPNKTKINIIGANWKMQGQWIEWKFETPETGFYYLNFRYQQCYNKDFFVNRRLYLDGSLPFDEARSLRFKYNLDWELAEAVSKSGEKLGLYLEKGEHVIRLEVVLGEYEQSIINLSNSVSMLNELYRKIIMITSVNPDKYQDYYLERSITELIPTLTECRDTMRNEFECIKQITGSNGSEASLLNVFSSQLDDMIKSPETIPQRISEFNNNIGSLSAWCQDIKNQPLDLDYIYFAEKNAPVPKKKAGFFERVVHELKAFFYSFVQKSSELSETGDETDKKATIKVWVTSGKDHAQIIRTMVDDLYTPLYKTNVELKLVNTGIVEAFLSGNSPDVVLSTGRGQPVNLAMRGALKDLRAYEDFLQVEDWFMPSAITPYQFEGGCFGLPDTQNFYMMFYRKDIFRQLGITPPNTWDDFYDVLPRIQRYNMDVGVPYVAIDAAGAVDAGMGTRNIFPSLLYQQGGEFFTENLTSTALNSQQAVDAFEKWCRLYKDYGLPLTYDFFNRFRSGQVPLAIAPYTSYTQLEVAAPEIDGLWDMMPIPGTQQADNSINRQQAGSGTASVILSNTQNPDRAWEFLKWWSSETAQTRYALDIESQLGALARVPVANKAAFKALSWDPQRFSAVYNQWEQVREIPEIPGGYLLIRGIDNAFRSVVYQDKNAKDTLKVYNKQINDEITRKRGEFALD